MNDLATERTSRWIRRVFDSLSILLVCVTVGVSVGWMIDADKKNERIRALQRKISKLERTPLADHGATTPTASKKLESAPANSVAPIRARPVKATINRNRRRRLIDVTDFMNKVKSITNNSEMDSLDFQADNIPKVVQPLIDCCSDPEHVSIATHVLRRICAEHENTSAVAEELYGVIETYRYAIDDRSRQTCKSAYTGLISLNPDNQFDLQPLIAIMNDDLSPWSAYACIAVKILEPDTNVATRMAQLLRSKYQLNRLVCARKILDYVEIDLAANLLREARVLEDDPEVKDAIMASINRIERELADASEP